MQRYCFDARCKICAIELAKARTLLCSNSKATDENIGDSLLILSTKNY